MGPIKGDTTILSYESADEGTNIKATGHHSVVNIPGTDEWYICDRDRKSTRLNSSH